MWFSVQTHFMDKAYITTEKCLLLHEYIHSQPKQDYGKDLFEVSRRDVLYEAGSDLCANNTANSQPAEVSSL